MLTALRTILQAAAKSLGVERAAYDTLIQELWAEAVGPEVAARTRPRGLRGGILWVDSVPGPWAQDFSLQRTKFVAALNTRLGAPVIRDIRVRQSATAVRSRNPQRLPSPPPDPPPLNPEELGAIERVVSEISDLEVREAAKRAMISQWRWRKRRGAEPGARR